MIKDIGFIVMEKISWIPLEKCRKDLLNETKRSIVQQLRGFVQEWRKIEGPYFGSVDVGHAKMSCSNIRGIRNLINMDLLRQEKSSTKGWWKHSVTPDPVENSARRMKPWQGESLPRGKMGKGTEKCSCMGIYTKATGIVDWDAAGYNIMAKEYFGLRYTAL